MTRKSARRKTSAKKELAQTFYEMRIYAEKNFGKTMTDTNDPKECDAPQHEMDSFLICQQIYSRKSDSARRFHYFASNFLQMLNYRILRNLKNQIMQFQFTTKIQGFTALLICLCIFTQGLKAENTRHLKSYSEFKDYAIQWGSNKMTSELNRAIKHLQLIHGNSFNPFKAAQNF